jgi:hypothetical protein
LDDDRRDDSSFEQIGCDLQSVSPTPLFEIVVVVSSQRQNGLGLDGWVGGWVDRQCAHCSPSLSLLLYGQRSISTQ